MSKPPPSFPRRQESRCRSDTCIRQKHLTRLSFPKNCWKCRILESDIPIIPKFSQGVDIGFFVGYKYPTYVETEQSMQVGFSNPTFQSFLNFRRVWTSVFLSDTSIRPTLKPNNPRRSDSRIRHSNHSRIFAMCGHRFFVGYKYPTYVETEQSM